MVHIGIGPYPLRDPTMRGLRKQTLALPLMMAVAFWPGVSDADPVSDIGASDTEILIGNIMPYTGPLAAFGTIGKAEAAYFDMVNDHGGINGRKIKFISYDDSSNPATAVEQTRKFAEQPRDQVLSERQEDSSTLRRIR